MNAQNSRAKILINAFEKQIAVANKALEQNFFKTAEGKISALERSLASIKKKDPSYNTTDLQQKLEDLKIRCGANRDETLTKRSNDKEQYYANVKTKNSLDDIRYTRGLSEEEANQLLALDISTIDMSEYQTSIEKQVDKTLNKDLPTIKARITEVPIVQEALIHYNKFVAQKRYWQTVSKLMPNSDLIKKVLSKYEVLDTELGGEAGVKSSAKEQYTEYIKNKKMPKAVVKDAAAESIIKKAYEDEGRRQGYNRTLKKINLLEGDWTILTKKYTGVIVGRKRSAAIAFKDNKTGECILYRFFEVYQQFTGSGYGNGKGTSTNQEPIPCENIN